MAKLPTDKEVEEFHKLSEEFHTYDPASGTPHNFWTISATKLNRYNNLASKMSRLAAIPKKKPGRPKKVTEPHVTKQQKRKTHMAKLMMDEELRKKAVRQLRKKKGAENETDVD